MAGWAEADRFLMGEALTASLIPAHLHRLSEEIGPRWAGSAGERAAADYIQASFERFGLSNVRSEGFELDTWDCSGASITVEGRPDWIVDVRAALYCDGCDVAGPLFDVGHAYPGSLPALRSRLPGSIALVDAGYEPFTPRVPLPDRLSALASSGVRAVIVVSPAPGRRTQHFSAADWRGGEVTGGPLPVVQTSREHGRVLAQAAAAGAGVRVRVEARRSRRPSVNSVGELPGTRWPDAHLLLASHHDTTPDSPGANDNGSGTAVVLEAARLLSSLKTVRQGHGCTVRFVTFGGEEQTLQGSSAYVRLHHGPEPGPLLMINLDELATGDMKGVALQFPELRGLVQGALDSMDEGLQCHVMPELDASGDMYPFALAGIPSGMLWRWRFVGRHPDTAYGHSSTDTVDKVRVRELRHYAGLLARLLLRLADLDPAAWPENRLDPTEVRRRSAAERGTVVRTM